MKKITALLVAVLTAFSILVFHGSALYDSGDVTAELDSQVYYMESLDEGTVFFEKDSDKKMPIAGFSKIISAIVALEKWQNLDGEIKITKEALSVIQYGYGFKTALYKEGETVSKKELFDCLVVYSANDALSIIAYDVSGSQDAFMSEMQALCEKIGCESTVIKNLTGYDTDGQYTTAADVAKIVKYACNYPLFVEAFSLKSVTLKATELNSERIYSSTNKMTNAGIPDYYHSSVVSGKHTSTEKAGECIAVVSNKDGYSYFTVVMGGKITNIDSDEIEENTSMTDARKMLDWVYNNIRYRTVVTPTQTVKVIKVTAGKDTDTLRLVPEGEVSALVPANASPESVLFEIVEGSLEEKTVAPVEAGEVLARAKVYYAHQQIAEVNLVAANNIEMSLFALIMSGVSTVFASKVFIIIVALLTIGAVAVFVMSLLDYRKKELKVSLKKSVKKQSSRTSEKADKK